jgi:hypothetical protein
MTFAPDYVDVATRIAEFRDKYPDGSLQPHDPAIPYRVETIDGQAWIVVVAAAYRDDEDTRPGVGMAWEQYPGKTPYTRGSELQNAETSAWGRAIVAALAADTKRGVASADEVRNRSAEREQGWADGVYDANAALVNEADGLDFLRTLYVEAEKRGDTAVMEAARTRAEAVKG